MRVSRLTLICWICLRLPRTKRKPEFDLIWWIRCLHHAVHRLTNRKNSGLSHTVLIALIKCISFYFMCINSISPASIRFKWLINWLSSTTLLSLYLKWFTWNAVKHMPILIVDYYSIQCVWAHILSIMIIKRKMNFIIGLNQRVFIQMNFIAMKCFEIQK